MPRPKKKKLHFAYAEDMCGLWLYLTDGENYELVTDRPIIREPMRTQLRESIPDCRPTLEAVNAE